MLLLLVLCSESWLLLAGLQSADRLEAESGVSGGGAYRRNILVQANVNIKAVWGVRPAELSGVVQHGSWVGQGHPVQSEGASGGRGRGVQERQGPLFVFVVLRGKKTFRAFFFSSTTSTIWNLHPPIPPAPGCGGPTWRSGSRAGEWGRRGVECPELGGEGEARVEEVMEEGM